MCLTVFIEDDDKLEGEENFSVSATSLDPSVSFDGNSTTVEIVDGDSMYKCCLKYLAVFTFRQAMTTPLKLNKDCLE